MNDSSLEALLRRDRFVVAAALAVLAGASWLYILSLSAAMEGSMPITTPGMAGMFTSSFSPWSVSDFAFMFVMWAVMMVGMMTPSATPMILIHARVARQANEQGKAFASTAWFVLGYLLSWTGFSLCATILQWILERGALLTPMMKSASPILGGLLLISAGIYQWTPIKDTCLSHCQAPLAFIQRQGGLRKTALGSLKLGFIHGSYCVGCCWALMALLFVGGVMNILWIAGLAIFVLVEKVIPAGRVLARTGGAGLVIAGLFVFAQ